MPVPSVLSLQDFDSCLIQFSSQKPLSAHVIELRDAYHFSTVFDATQVRSIFERSIPTKFYFPRGTQPSIHIVKVGSSMSFHQQLERLQDSEQEVVHHARAIFWSSPLSEEYEWSVQIE